MKKYVQIQSSINIQVHPGLSYNDYTKKDSDVPDRLKIAPTWPKKKVLILKGQHLYESEIVEWPAIKALEKDGILTIGQDFDNKDATNNVEEKKTKKVKDVSLEELGE